MGPLQRHLRAQWMQRVDRFLLKPSTLSLLPHQCLGLGALGLHGLVLAWSPYETLTQTLLNLQIPLIGVLHLYSASTLGAHCVWALSWPQVRLGFLLTASGFGLLMGRPFASFEGLYLWMAGVSLVQLGTATHFGQPWMVVLQQRQALLQAAMVCLGYAQAANLQKRLDK